MQGKLTLDEETEERAAILEYLAKMPRAKAERRAIEMTEYARAIRIAWRVPMLPGVGR